jgi:fatty-acyl-CoA synthase
MTDTTMTILSAVRRAALRDPGKSAIEYLCEDGTREIHSYADLFSDIARYTTILRRAGVDRGSRVAILGANSYQYVTAVLAVTSLAATAALLPVVAPDNDMQEMLNELSPDLIVGDRACLTRYETVLKASGSSGRILDLSQQSAWGDKQDAPWWDLLSAADVPVGQDGAMTLYTSGSTGRPRGVILSHRSVIMNSWNSVVEWNFRANDRVLIGLPLYHVSMVCTTLLPTLQVGATAVVVTRLSPANIRDCLVTTEATVVLALPYMYKVLVAETRTSSVTSLSLRLALYGMAGMPRSLADGIRGVLGAEMASGFGQTESGGNTLILSAGDHDQKCGSIGRPVLNTEVRLMSDMGALLPPRCGTTGELVYRGPSMAAGYLDEQQGGAAAISDGWLHSGDLAYEDADGFFWFQGRLRDVIKSGGENVYAAKVEQALLEIPGVREAAVVGVPSDRWGEEVIAFVVEAPGTRIDLSSAKQTLKERLAPYEVPKAIEVLPDLPRSAAGKVAKRRLLEQRITGSKDTPRSAG